jgi:hypothetical protein
MSKTNDFAMPGTMGALAIAAMAFAAFIMLTCTGCTQTLAPAFGMAQGVTDGIASRAGQTDTLQSVREGLAEAEARKVGRQLLPRDAVALPAVYVDDYGNTLTNGVTLSAWYKVERRIVERTASAPPSPPVGLTPSPTPPAASPPPAGGDLLGEANSTVTP